MTDFASLEAAIHQFLRTQQVDSLCAYIGTTEQASPQERATALGRKRVWAQTLRNNPKYRREADWVLRHYRRLITLIVHNPREYQAMCTREKLRMRAEGAAPDLQQAGKSIPAPIRKGLLSMCANLPPEQLALLLQDEEQWHQQRSSG